MSRFMLWISLLFVGTGPTLGSNNDYNVHEFVSLLQIKTSGLVTVEQASKMNHTVEKILSESKVSSKIRKRILKDAQDYIKAAEIADIDKSQVEDLILAIQDMFFYSANFPKNSSEQIQVLKQIDDLYERTQKKVEGILRTEGYEEYIGHMQQKLAKNHDFMRTAAQNWFYPAFFRVAAPKTLELISNRMVGEVQKRLKEEPKKNFISLKLKKLYLVDLPISKFSKEVLEAYGFPEIHPIPMKKDKKSAEVRKPGNDLTVHPVAVAFYLIVRGSNLGN